MWKVAQRPSSTWAAARWLVFPEPPEPQAHLNAIQQLAHAPVGVSLNVAKHLCRHTGDIDLIHVLLVCTEQAWKIQEAINHLK